MPLETPKAAIGALVCSEAELRAALKRAIGGDEAIFAGPLGGRVQVGQAIVDHMMAGPARRDGREGSFR